MKQKIVFIINLIFQHLSVFAETIKGRMHLEQLIKNMMISRIEQLLGCFDIQNFYNNINTHNFFFFQIHNRIMKFFSYLPYLDRTQLEEIVNAIQKIKKFVNQKLDALELLANQNAERINYYNNSLDIINSCEQLYNTQNIQAFMNNFEDFMQKGPEKLISVLKNQVLYQNPSFFQKLHYTDAILQLEDLYNHFKLQMANIENLIICEHQGGVKFKSYKQFQNCSIDVWHHPNLLEKNGKLNSYNFNKFSGVGEPFLCIQNLELEGFYMAQLFKGVNSSNENVDYQNQSYKLQYSIHEGINLSKSIYSEQIEIMHKNMQMANNCYVITLKKNVKLRKGQLYTISLVSKEKEKFQTQIFGDLGTKSYINFLGVEIDLIDQIVITTQNMKQSPIPGLIIKLK